jgi:CDP-glucose 4,6-dehydratase
MNSFYEGKKVFITGHTGFKGSWLTKILSEFGAEVTGYSLEPLNQPNLFSMLDYGPSFHHNIGDIRDYDHLSSVFHQAQPEIVFHLAAQPIVRESFKDPRMTYDVNVMGTVNILDCVRNSQSVKSFVNITTDKVYKNNEWIYGYRENDILDGFDPYSNSKSCSELVTASFIRSFLSERKIAVSTVRAGNVIGGGDFASDRIIPDCVRAVLSGESMKIRNPYSTRPYQHVLEPLYVYMTIAMQQAYDFNKSGKYNIGPNDNDCVSTGTLVELFSEIWKTKSTIDFKFEIIQNSGPHEANFLKLDSSLIKSVFQWKPKWDVKTAVVKTIDWTIAFNNKEDIDRLMKDQITEYFSL